MWPSFGSTCGGDENIELGSRLFFFKFTFEMFSAFLTACQSVIKISNWAQAAATPNFAFQYMPFSFPLD